MIAHDSTHSSASSSSSECTSDCSGLCCNVLTIQEENDLYTTLLSTTDRRTRKTIQDILANKSGEKEKEKQKTDPQAYINASVERNTRQFIEQTVNEIFDLNSVNIAISDLQKRVSALEAVTYVPDDPWNFERKEEAGETSNKSEDVKKTRRRYID